MSHESEVGVPAFPFPSGLPALGTGFLFLFCALVAYTAANAIYSVTLDPLARIPGPKLCAVTRIPYWLQSFRGTDCQWLRELHRKYGPVVRFGPIDVSFATAEAWKDIYGPNDKGRQGPYRAKDFGVPTINGVPNLLQADDESHARVRKVLAPAFSERALREQEPLFQKYVDLLMARLHELGEGGQPVEVVRLYNFTSFDIMADLCFGRPMELLSRNDYSPWLTHVLEMLRAVPFFTMILYYPLTRFLFTRFQPGFVLEQRKKMWQHTVDRVNRRLEENPDRPDIWNLVLKNQGSEKALSVGEMHSNAEVFMIAGSETIATLLSGATYYLASNPDKLKRLAGEIRGNATRIEDLDFDSLTNLPYLNACIKEGLRIYPPAPSALTRVIPAGGQAVAGRWLPGGTRVAVAQWASFRSEANFRDADTFVPERWIAGEDADYAGDARDVFQPFSFGPRNCLGRNMAMHEMRLILASLIWNFDVELDADHCREIGDWADQRTYLLWEKKPLMCRLKPVAT